MDAIERERRIQTVCLLVLAALAVTVGLWWFRSVLVPFVLAVFFAFGLTPLIDLQVRRWHLPHVLAVVSTLVLGVVVLGGIGLLVSISVGQLTANADLYAVRATELADQVASWFSTTFHLTAIKPSEGGLLGLTSERLGAFLLDVATAVTGILQDGALMLIFLCFLLFGSRTRTGPAGGLLGEIEPTVRNYITVKIVLSAATGILTGLWLWLMGVELAIMLGLLAFLLNFIPAIGSIIAVLLPLPIVLLDPQAGWMKFTGVLLPLWAMQFTIGNIIEPRMTGKSCQLHAIAVMLALMFWGMLWGIVGMLLATPLTALIRMLLGKSDLTRPVADLLAGDLRAVLSDN